MPIEHTEWEPSFLHPIADARLESSLRKENGGPLPPGTRHISRCPWLARSPALFNWFQGRLLHIDINLAEMLAKKDPELAVAYGFVPEPAAV